MQTIATMPHRRPFTSVAYIFITNQNNHTTKNRDIIICIEATFTIGINRLNNDNVAHPYKGLLSINVPL
jgi:hypothetical protein